MIRSRTSGLGLSPSPGRLVLRSAVCILTLTFFSVSSAQSYLNMRGLGELSPTGDARAAGLGDPAALSSANPGILVRLPQTSFNLTALAAGVVGAESNYTRPRGTALPAAFNAAFPLPFQTRLLLGLNQKFSQDFDVWSPELPDTAYRRHVVGRGGIYTLRAGLAKSFADRFCIGAEYNHVLGSARENWRFEVGPDAVASTDTIELNYSASTFRVGAAFETERLSAGAYYEPGLALTARRFWRVHGTVSDTERVYQLSIPHSLLAGLSLAATEDLNVVAGFALRPWQSATIGRGDSTSALEYRNVWRGSLGLEYLVIPNYPLRLGYSYQNWYFFAAQDNPYQYMYNPNPIVEHGLHFGTSFPVPKFGSLDLAGEVLLRDAGNLRETAGRLTLTLAYREAWTRRTRRWGY